MFQQLLQFWSDYFSLFRWIDLLDIALVSVLVYQLLKFLRGTRAIQIFVGLVVLALFYWVADRVELRSLSALLGNLFDNWILILILIFHQDIRRALSKFGETQIFSERGKEDQGRFIEELVKSAGSLATRKIGALIVIERQADVNEFAEAGIELDARLTREALTSIFMPVSPLHDGAVIIRDGRILKAGCFLPLSLNPLLSSSMGTRHRAALGITEETDAVCIVVSEEKGSLSFARAGKISHDLESAQVRKLLLESLMR